MTLPDVNVLLSAFRQDSQRHALCDHWLKSVIDGRDPFGVSPQVLSAVIRLATNPRVFIQPSPLAQAIGFCDDLLQQPHCIVIEPRAQHWTIFEGLLRTAKARGDLVSDAWLAALAIESGCEWLTLDRDFRKFQGLKWRLLS